MKLVLEILGSLSVLELTIWFKPFWRWRLPVAYILIIALLVVGGLIMGIQFGLWTVIVLLLNLYRIVNLLRLIEGRMQEDFLYNATRRTSVWLILLQIGLLGILAFSNHYEFIRYNWLYMLSGVQLVTAVTLLLSCLRNIRVSKPLSLFNSIADRDLPTLTVAIPARNETEDLENCLQSLISCDYPKLEILVLDDCSQNEHTPEIIRSFAQAGVRFIAGQLPPEYWLAKNFAYKQLAEEASGEIILFCGVDVRFSDVSLNNIVKVFVSDQKKMMCIVPRNLFPANERFAPLFIQPSRYAWEFMLPRWLFGRPPVLSTCWIISAETLKDAGGFDAVSRKIIPESYFARQVAKFGKGYSFLRAENGIGVTSQKSFIDQRATAIRTRYPQLHRRIELVALISSAEFTLLVWPPLLFMYALITKCWPLVIVSAFGWLVASLVQSKIINLTYRKFIFIGLWILPLSAMYDIALLNYSMWQYEFGEVNWKGRNVCIPIMNINLERRPSLEQK